jgi:hypothetical protein
MSSALELTLANISAAIGTNVRDQFRPWSDPSDLPGSRGAQLPDRLRHQLVHGGIGHRARRAVVVDAGKGE